MVEAESFLLVVVVLFLLSFLLPKCMEEGKKSRDLCSMVRVPPKCFLCSLCCKTAGFMHEWSIGDQISLFLSVVGQRRNQEFHDGWTQLKKSCCVRIKFSISYFLFFFLFSQLIPVFPLFPIVLTINHKDFGIIFSYLPHC